MTGPTGPRTAGPLTGRRVLQMAAIGPVPLCAMLMADLGAEVLCVERPGQAKPLATDLTRRGRTFIALDLRSVAGRETALRLAGSADVLLEGFRPGVMERLGLAPATCLARNPRLVYGRMTGWGQEGPLARTAGHDINYIALSGALHAIGRAGKRPVPPLNLVGDYGGGALYLAFGVVCALLEREMSGRGQVVDAAMVDGAASLMTLFHGLAAAGRWSEARGANLLDGGAPWYDTYETADGRYVAVGALEAPFWDELLRRLDIAADELPPRDDPAGWPRIRERLAAAFRRHGRDEWAERFAGSDGCVAPVLSLHEAPGHAHNRARRTYIEVDGVVQPNVAPRFGRTPGAIRPPNYPEGAALAALLDRWGVPPTAAAKEGDPQDGPAGKEPARG